MRSRRLCTGLFALVLAACGGSGGSDGGTTTPPTAPTTPTTPVTPVVQANAMAVSIDAGPAALLANSGAPAANILYATVTVCTPGSTAACQVIDHVQVDTGSTGLRLLASALGSAVPAATTDPATGRTLLECVQFADGYSWGSVKTMDATLGSRKISALPIHVIGDAAAGSAPASCVSGPLENDIAAFGANGILGVGNFLQDCGQACVTQGVAARYYTCSNPAGGASCTPVAVALARQVPNPVSQFSADNNGVVIQIPSVAAPASGPVNATMLFGVATQSNNALGSAAVYKLSSAGKFTTVSSGVTYPNSFIDSGSNAYFFASPTTIRTCPDASFFYCPVNASNAPTSVAVAATIMGTNGASASITFTVDNDDSLFIASNVAFPGLAGPDGTIAGGVGPPFDWGLPFFFGRSVYVIIEGSSVNGVAAPAIAF